MRRDDLPRWFAPWLGVLACATAAAVAFVSLGAPADLDVALPATDPVHVPLVATGELGVGTPATWSGFALLGALGLLSAAAAATGRGAWWRGCSLVIALGAIALAVDASSREAAVSRIEPGGALTGLFGGAEVRHRSSDRPGARFVAVELAPSLATRGRLTCLPLVVGRAARLWPGPGQTEVSVHAVDGYRVGVRITAPERTRDAWIVDRATSAVRTDGARVHLRSEPTGCSPDASASLAVIRDGREVAAGRLHVGRGGLAWGGRTLTLARVDHDGGVVVRVVRRRVWLAWLGVVAVLAGGVGVVAGVAGRST